MRSTLSPSLNLEEQSGKLFSCQGSALDTNKQNLYNYVDFGNQEGIRRLEEAIAFADQILHVDTKNVEPLISVLHEQCLPVREDQVTEGFIRDQILANASVTEEEYFKAIEHYIWFQNNVTSEDRLFHIISEEKAILRIEVRSLVLEDSPNNPLEIISVWKPEIFEQLEADENLKTSIKFKDTKNEKKTTWPCLITSRTTLEPATLFCLIDAYTSNKNTSSLVLHHSLAPYAVGVLVDGASTDMKQLQDLRRLFTIKLNNLKISVLPSGANWNTPQCDARGLPYLILLSDSTLENGICHLRNRDTTLKEEVHVSDVVQRLHTVLKK
uniref:EOG090X076T n=1 Tax=Evadne anonyx TaxID=141404 RepID=A0A9N6ZE27_9CRUS|nr:EOG090X076T [Evadne anonyx]